MHSGIHLLYRLRRSAGILFVAFLALASGTAPAQEGDAVFIVGPDGDVVTATTGGVGGPPLIVLDSDGRILSSNAPDCARTVNRPQCRTVQYLKGVDLPKPGAVLLTSVQSSVHPPPVIIVEGMGVVNCYALVGNFDCN